MKVLLTTLNSKYIHSNLAVYYLKGYCEQYHDDEFVIREFTINDDLDRILGEIYKEKPEVIGFSCYIWNISQTMLLIDNIKKVLPDCIIILGGPEVWFDGDRLMQAHPYIDYIIVGEGEMTLKELLDALKGDMTIRDVLGILYRDCSSIVYTGDRPLIKDLNDIPFPYKDGFSPFENRIIYYETSRGCPFNCQYCLSSTIEGVRVLPMDRIKRELRIFIEAGVPQVKLVDRTFNCNVKRAKEIFRTIIELGGRTNFHFEMGGDLIDDEMLEILKDAPPGLFQFEIGVQSTNAKTLEMVARKTDLQRIAHAVNIIRGYNNIHMHLDLIAGLPEEDYTSFGKSFDDVYRLYPDKLQLGFLKMLKGSGIRRDAKKHEYEYRSYPPYEVLENKYIYYGDLLCLKDIEELVEKYYNSHRFDGALKYLIQYHDNSPFKFFESFASYWAKKGYFKVSHSMSRLYGILIEYAKKVDGVSLKLFNDIIKFDFCTFQRPSNYPEGIIDMQTKNFREAAYDFIRNWENVKKYLPDYYELTTRQIMRRIHIELFAYDVVGGIESGRYDKKKITVLFKYDTNHPLRRSIYYVIELPEGFRGRD
ncbi:B12-binding domain-containing radical SAM protein [Xylanivirga thermophila]|uniref:B12-binding domain-containing radical SAM protein n=1 Tax=Xylanivirga thermophila TaxID=2496273 RepID=UPI00101E08D0|nr:B12-binding domain-containing radical SAM protein [Xylanivirga thermophila]